MSNSKKLLIAMGVLFIGFGLWGNFNSSGLDVTGRPDKILSKYNYDDWKKDIDVDFQEWKADCKDADKSDYNGLYVYINAATARRVSLCDKLDKFANLSPSQIESLKEYANKTCDESLEKMKAVWHENELKARPNKY